MNLIRQELRLRARFEKYGTLQRMSIACRSETDAAEALAVGEEAVRLALAGETDRMVVLRRESDDPYSCDARNGVARGHRQRAAPAARRDDPGAAHRRHAAFRRYAEPLLGAPLPRHARLT